MPGESQQTPDTAADPTVATMEAIQRASDFITAIRHAELDVLRARLDAMDEATKVLKETVTRMPTDVQQAVAHLNELVDVKFDLTGVKFGSVALQFAERDERAARESRDNKIAVDAAFAAQEKLAVQQNLSNQTAIEKSEKTTNELIRQNAEAGRQAQSAQSDQIADIKERITRLEATKLGATEQRQETRSLSGALWGAIGTAVGLMLAAITIIGIIAANGP